MPNLIDDSYFFGAISIAQLSTVQNELTWMIDVKEPELLSLLLGDTLYALFIAGQADQRFIDLKKQFIKSSGSSKISNIAYYVYYWYMRNVESITTGTGEKNVASQNATNTSPRFKTAYAWNEMVKMNHEIRNYLKVNISTYPEYAEPARTTMFNYINSLPTSYSKYNQWLGLYKKINPFI